MQAQLCNVRRRDRSALDLETQVNQLQQQQAFDIQLQSLRYSAPATNLGATASSSAAATPESHRIAIAFEQERFRSTISYQR